MLNRKPLDLRRAPVVLFTGARVSLCARVMGTLVWLVVLCGCSERAAPAPSKSRLPAPPPGVFEIRIDRPVEVSGLAAHPSGVVVVGDEDGSRAYQWPSGASWPLSHTMADCESIDIGMAPGKTPVVFAISEDHHTVRDSDGGMCILDAKQFKERHNRGIEGISVRLAGDGLWDVAVVWEGGFSQSRDGWHNARVALFQPWRRGATDNKPTKTLELDVPVPSTGQRFRATDVIWHGDGLSVLLGATAKHGASPYNHTWIQRFALDGKPTGQPMKLEDMPRYKQAWRTYRAGRNWEALDWSLDGTSVYLGHDANGASVVCKIRYPQ